MQICISFDRFREKSYAIPVEAIVEASVYYLHSNEPILELSTDTLYSQAPK
ncbi:MAG: hypothetical protein LBU32_04670 [Clostridiales bacterium]|nr:hypothetical protein [Clostridiales bacterium]